MDKTYPKKFDSSNLNEEEKAVLSAFFARRSMFDFYLKENAINIQTCPGCGFPTLSERGGYEICDVCNWEDDNQDDKEADEIWGGPNYHLSLTENRLMIGKELNDIAKKQEGKIIDDPKVVLSIFSDYNVKRRLLFDKLPGDADINHPIFIQSRQMGESLLRQLIIDK